MYRSLHKMEVNMPRGKCLNIDDPIMTKRNLSLEVELFRNVRAECVRRKYPLSYLVNGLLQEWLDTQKDEELEQGDVLGNK